jgi:hypothetical protein
MSETIIKQPNDSTLLNETVPRVAVKKKAKDLIDARYVIIYDPTTGKPLGASDFFFEQQADAVISQANPVSTTLYEILPTTKNVRIISIWGYITWAVTQPTPLEVLVTIDGITKIFIIANPVSGTSYGCRTEGNQADNAQTMVTTHDEYNKPFMLEGRSVRVQIRITWAVTQPTPLVCRMK